MSLQGTVCPMVTPATADGAVDESALRAFSTHLLDRGLDGLMPCGSTGEFASLTREQRRTVIETVADASDDGFVVAGCGDTSLAGVRRLLADAAEVGADAAAIIAPSYYLPTSQDALCTFFETVADDSPLPILLYNNTVYSQGFSVESVVRLAGHDRIVGIKDSSGELTFLHEVVTETPDSFAVFQGAEDQSVAGLDLGIDGLVPGMSNVFPGACSEILPAYVSGDRERAVEIINDVVMPTLRAVLSTDALLAAIKHFVECTGYDVGEPFPPAATLTSEERASLQDQYGDIVASNPRA